MGKALALGLFILVMGSQTKASRVFDSKRVLCASDIALPFSHYDLGPITISEIHVNSSQGRNGALAHIDFAINEQIRVRFVHIVDQFGLQIRMPTVPSRNAPIEPKAFRVIKEQVELNRRLKGILFAHYYRSLIPTSSGKRPHNREKIAPLTVTSVQIRLPRSASDPVKAYVRIFLNNAVELNSLRLLRKASGKYFLAMPSRPDEWGDHFDLVHPLSLATRRTLEQAVFEEFCRVSHLQRYQDPVNKN